MAQIWNRIVSNLRSRFRTSDKSSWQYYYCQKINYGWLKKPIAAVCLFVVLYGAHLSDTWLGLQTDNAVRYILSQNVDVDYWADRAAEYGSKYFPHALNWPSLPVVKQIRNTIAKPADPLMYMTKPVEGQLVSPFGWRSHPVLKQENFHEGIDVAAPAGASVKAAAPGKIKLITESAQLGKVLIIEHGQNIETLYGHLNEVLVQDGENVSQGQVIARVGQTGMTDTPVLYFEVRENGTAIDPMTRIKGQFPQSDVN
ncbi:MAG TPA: M23 family metallopeptidase [Methylomusa anaerophila]|uniref:Murein DD-endopeptidase MepM n=1 Tax=Methylomusa anaerophila TaxID=1930071 RepID=A0A348AF99_9FIRM|nr:M23 family metallopeptidase [Methylomusa anaerophila]BBB89747.1 murein DD-endopeptidase MepM [Methylomusa anaerophila]HML89207.1 M23 family metallopeptidase [Methylomusa anaerophila]